MAQDEMIFRLILSAFFGGLIGIEREMSHRPAGLRTHILVSLGSTLIMLISLNSFSTGDPARLAAQVVSGIGFLGAGTILREGNEVRGLTTAASLWVSAGIGLAIGAGEYLLAGVSVFIVLFSLVSLGFVQKQVSARNYKKIKLVCNERLGLLADIGRVIAQHDTIVRDMKITRDETIEVDNPEIYFSIMVSPPSELAMNALIDEIKCVKDVLKVDYITSKVSR